MAAGQIVDTETAQEFMAQALAQASRPELGAIVAELERKGAGFQARLAPEALPQLERADLRALLRSVFATRRQADALLDAIGGAELRGAIQRLLYDPAPVQARFQGFVDALSGYCGDVRLARRPRPGSPQPGELPEHIWCDLAAELLHFTRPDDRWLWTRWIWDPRAGTGALPLVVEDRYDLQGRDAGETYLKVGVAAAFVRATGEAADFARFSLHRSPFGIDVFLACVYAVYLYTTLRLRRSCRS